VFEGGEYFFTKAHRPFKDTSHAPVLPKPEIIKPVLPVSTAFVPSKFIYTAKDNNLIINLPEAATKKYSLKFYDDKDNPVFTLDHITEPYLIVERANFIHAGWYHYQLFDGNTEVEKYKFFITKEGK
jgi:hypothetical protein